MSGKEQRVHFIAVDAVTTSHTAGVGIGLVSISPSGEMTTKSANTQSSSRRAGIVIGMASAIDMTRPDANPDDRFEIVTVIDRAALLSNPNDTTDPQMLSALALLNAALARAQEARLTIALSKADAREVSCLSEATRQATMGLLSIQQAIPA